MKKRPSANQTRRHILNAAKQLFLQRGFDGVTTQQIAKAAHVNSNLIFHHYQNKQTLWQSVKADIIEQNHPAPQYDRSHAAAYFASILEYRFSLYRNNPDLAKLVQWQQVTNDEAALVGNEAASPHHWIEDFKYFQQQGQIKANINPDLIMLFIIYSSHAPFMQQVIPMNAAQQRMYQEWVLQSCIQQFIQPPGDHHDKAPCYS